MMAERHRNIIEQAPLAHSPHFCDTLARKASDHQSATTVI
jgi:hypothetical protein